MSIKKLFISWSTADVGVFGDFLHVWIPSTRATVDTWISRDPKCLPSGGSLGSGFPEKVMKAMGECDACLALISPKNINSAWINFETGYFFGTGKPVFGMLCAEVSHQDLMIANHPLAASGVNFSYPDIVSLKKLFVSLEGGQKESIIDSSVERSFQEFDKKYKDIFKAEGPPSIDDLIAGLDY